MAWAGEYLNERLVGLGLGARMIHQRLADPTLSTGERAFLDRLVPALGELASESEHELYFDGAARLFSEAHVREVGQINELMELLEQRVALLSVMRTALSEPGVYVRIGRELELPAMRSLAMVAARVRRGAPPAGDRLGDRPGAHELRLRDPGGAGGGPRALAVR